jgi:hypothetical protein
VRIGPVLKGMLQDKGQGSVAETTAAEANTRRCESTNPELFLTAGYAAMRFVRPNV